MWLFQSPKQRLREVALKIIKGLADGTIVPDPPLLPDPPMDRDKGEALPQECEIDTALSVFSTSSISQGMYGSFAVGPPASVHSSHKAKKRVNCGGFEGRRFVVVTGGPRQEIVRDALLQ
jgi:hypothetical protein